MHDEHAGGWAESGDWIDPGAKLRAARAANPLGEPVPWAAAEPLFVGEPPCSNRGVGSHFYAGETAANRSTAGPSRTVFGWDWSSTTHHAAADAVPDLLDAVGAVYVVQGRGLREWTRSAEGFDPDGYSVGRVFFGGPTGTVHVQATSTAAHAARTAVAGMLDARTARVDTRVDTLAPLEHLWDLCQEVARPYGSLITEIKSEVRGESRGRTFYIGSPKSAIRVRVYEKWLESPGQYEEGTNRVEVQLRPASRVKGIVSEWAPVETFCASRTTRALADMLADEVVPTRTLHIRRGTPDLERSLAAMGKQYGRAVNEYLIETGGDLDKVLWHLLRGRSEDFHVDGPSQEAHAATEAEQPGEEQVRALYA